MDDGESDGPDGVAHGITFTGFNDFGEVFLESVEQVVDDGGYRVSISIYRIEGGPYR